MVIRLDRNGKLLTRYEVPGLPFAVNLTPDAQYFWTATQDNGVASRFHIASGAGATLNAGAAGVFGLCVKREYSAATSNGQCFDLNTDGSYGPGTSACRTPAVCTAGGVDGTGAPNAECLPPGMSLPAYPPLTNREGDRVSLDLTQAGFVFNHVRGLDAIQGVTKTGNAIAGTIGPDTCTPAPGDDRCVFTMRVQWMLRSDFESGASQWQESAFTWTITHGNLRPTVRLPGTSPTTLPVLKPAVIRLAVSDLDSSDHVLASVTGLPAGFAAQRRTSYGDGWFIDISGTPGVEPVYPKAHPVHVDIWDCEKNFAEDTAAEVNALPPAQRDAALRAKIAAAGGSCYHSATPLDFTITIVNATPTLNPLPQVTLLGASVSYQIPASDADGHPLTWSVENLPADLSADANGLVTGTATVEASAQPVKVTVTDLGGSSVTRTFPWTVYSNRPPVCDTATITPRVLWPPNHKLVPFSIQNVTDADNDPLTIVITSITQNQPVNDKGDGNTGFDATGVGTSSGAVRAERTGNPRVPGDGRVYEVTFTASDGKTNGTCGGTLTIEVPHDQGRRATPAANGCRWNSVTGEQIGTCAWFDAPVRRQR